MPIDNNPPESVQRGAKRPRDEANQAAASRDDNVARDRNAGKLKLPASSFLSNEPYNGTAAQASVAEGEYVRPETLTGAARDAAARANSERAVRARTNPSHVILPKAPVAAPAHEIAAKEAFIANAPIGRPGDKVVGAGVMPTVNFPNASSASS